MAHLTVADSGQQPFILNCQRGRTRRPKTDYSVPVPKGYSKVLKTLEKSLADRLARLANKLMIMTAMTKERRGSKRHFIPFGRDAWVRLYGSDYAYKVADAAVKTGLIERNHTYAAYESCKFPKSIRLSGIYHRRFRRIEGVDEWTLDKKPRSKNKPKTSSTKTEVGRWLESKLLLFDVGAVGSFVPKNGWDALTADFIRRRDMYAAECDFGRFHTPYTAISRNSRRTLFLVEDGQKLVTIDIKNSQPLILGIVQQQRQQTGAHKQSVEPICVPLAAHCNESWTGICERGVVYETLLSLLVGLDLEPYVQQIGRVSKMVDPRTWNRTDIKKTFLMVLFSRWDDTVAQPLYHVLQLYFPALAAFIRDIKEGGNYQLLAQLCQRQESELMIQGVCGRLMREHPEIPVLTIHDALIVPESYQQMVIETIRDVYATVGLFPAMECAPISPHT